jgi:hypothetical protein
MKLSAHFELAEFTRSESAKRHGVSNEPTAEHIENMKLLCENILEPLRNHFGHPIHISSGYRSRVLNHYIGGTLKSQHLTGEAVDLDHDDTSYGTTNKMIFDYIKDNLVYDQLINEHNYSWIHVSYTKGNNRKQVLDATKHNGRTVYSLHK